jgi:hypothetical protein
MLHADVLGGHGLEHPLESGLHLAGVMGRGGSSGGQRCGNPPSGIPLNHPGGIRHRSTPRSRSMLPGGT